jgi:hypothetical protein
MKNFAKITLTSLLLTFVVNCGPDPTGEKGGVLPLGAPDDLLLTPNQGLDTSCTALNKLRVDWAVIDSSATHLQIERKMSAEEFALLAEVETSETYYVDLTAVNNIEYTFRVRLVIKDGSVIQEASDYSDEFTGMKTADCGQLDPAPDETDPSPL